jgi:hypothetical protein
MKKLRLIVFVMVTGFGVAIIGLTTLAQSTPAPPNPFLAYANVFPGQPASTVEARAFSCQQDYDHFSHPEDVHCTLFPTSDVFSCVEAKISKNTIYQLTFTMRDNTLRVGDLAVFLKMPTRYTDYGTAYFFSPGSIVIAKTADYAKRVSPFSPIWSISFTRFTK